MGTISPYGLGTCRDCRRTVRWAHTEANKNQPLDPEPDPEGSVVARLGGPAWYARVPTPERPQQPTERRFMPHAATCPATRPAAAPQALPAPTVTAVAVPLPGQLAGITSLTDHRRNRKDTRRG